MRFFRFSTHTTCEEHPNTGRVRLSDFYAMALHGGVLGRYSIGCHHWLVDEFYGVPATRTLFGLDCTCQTWFDSHLNCISWSMTLSEMLRLRGQILRPITDIAVNVVLSIIANAQKNGLVLSLIATISRTKCCYFKMEIALLFRVPDC